MEAVEWMWYVDEATLTADRRDGLGHRPPARDLLLEEQPDHLALLGRLDLLGHDHLDAPGLLRQLPCRERARDLVVVGDRDRAQSPLLRGLKEHLDGRRAIGRVVRVHVEVDVDRGPAGKALSHRRIAGGIATS